MWKYCQQNVCHHTGNFTVCSTSCLKNKNENFKALHYLPFCVGNSSLTSGFSSQRANNVESVPMPCRHLSVHDLMPTVACYCSYQSFYRLQFRAQLLSSIKYDLKLMSNKNGSLEYRSAWSSSHFVRSGFIVYQWYFQDFIWWGFMYLLS